MTYEEATEKIERKRAKPPKVKTVIAFSALIILMVCIFIIFQTYKAHDAAIVQGERNAERLTQIMADQVQLTFIAADLTLRRAVERHYFNELFGNNLGQDIENNLRLWVDETPQIVGLVLIDQHGQLRNAAFTQGYRNRIGYRGNFQHYGLFNYLADVSNKPSAITAHQHSNGDLILLGRRMTSINGEFSGIIMAMVDPQHFTRFFESVDSGTNRFMSLMQKDGSILFVGPERGAGVNRPIMQEISQNHIDFTSGENIRHATKTIKGRLHIFAYRQLSNLPIYLSVAIDEENFLSEWRDGRIKDVSFLAIFTVFGSVLTYFALAMAKQIMRAEESESKAILASQAKSEFLANMSHELRTPLNAIIGFSEMITAGYFGDLTEKQRERIHDIHLCGSHLLQLISDILEFSKGEAGKLELYEEIIELDEILEECNRIISEKAGAKHIKLKVEVEETLPRIQADKRKIRQVMLNLLSNAIKFTPEEGSVTMSARRERSGQILLQVRDTGIGIPEEEIQKALSVFGQVHRNQSHEGTGLGLPLCKMFTELHGGKLQLQSKVGHGTTVSVYLPSERIV